MPKFNPYLNFNGNTEEAFNFYKSVFGGEFATLMRFKDTQEGAKLSDQDKEKIMHIALPLGNETLLMATDALESMGQRLEVGNNMYLSINTDSKEEADRIFNGLSEGGKIEMAMADTFWGDYFGSFKDRYGIQWMISYHQQPAQQN
ncbi:MAG: VOC family protein [Williamsia sp.]|nr:VOC family protein [Williamsia sp.]